MGLTGNYQFRKSVWGKAILQVEEKVQSFWSTSGEVKRRWRDATPMDLADPALRSLVDMSRKLPWPDRTSSLTRSPAPPRKVDQAIKEQAPQSESCGPTAQTEG